MMAFVLAYSTVSLVLPLSTIDVWHGSINLTGPIKREIESAVTAAVSRDSG